MDARGGGAVTLKRLASTLAVGSWGWRPGGEGMTTVDDHQVRSQRGKSRIGGWLSSLLRGIFAVAMATVAFTTNGGTAHAGTATSIRVTDIRDVSAVVTWTGAAAETGTVQYAAALNGSCASSSYGSSAIDARGSGTSSSVHYARLENLAPSTLYCYRPVSGGSIGTAGSFTTGPTVGLGTSDSIYGPLSFNSAPASDVIIYITLSEGGLTSAPFSTIVKPTDGGFYIVQLQSARSSNNQTAFAYTNAATISLSIEGGLQGAGSQSVSLATARSVPFSLSVNVATPTPTPTATPTATPSPTATTTTPTATATTTTPTATATTLTPTATSTPTGTPTATVTVVTVRVLPDATAVAPGTSQYVVVQVQVPTTMTVGAITVDVTYSGAALTANSCTTYTETICNTQFGGLSKVRLVYASTSGFSGTVSLGSIKFTATTTDGSSSPLIASVDSAADIYGAPAQSAVVSSSVKVARVNLRAESPYPSAAPNGTVPITIKAVLASGANMGSWTIDLSYDSSKFAVASYDSSASGSVVNTTYAVGKVRLVGSSTTGLTGPAVIGIVTFNVTGAEGTSGDFSADAVFGDLATVEPETLGSYTTPLSLLINAAPTITSIAPTTGWPGGSTLVTITGSNFFSGATVAIGGVPATEVTVVNASQITAKSPKKPAFGDTNNSGTVNATDSLCVLRSVAGLPSTTGCPTAGLTSDVNVMVTNPNNTSSTLTNGYRYHNADMNNSGTVNATDSLCILRLVAGLPATTGCPRPVTTASVASVGARSASGPRTPAAPAVSLSVVETGRTATTVSIELRANVPAGTRLGSWLVDVSYPDAVMRVQTIRATHDGVANPATAPGRMRIAGASVDGLTGPVVLASIALQSTEDASEAILMPTIVGADALATIDGIGLQGVAQSLTVPMPKLVSIAPSLAPIPSKPQVPAAPPSVVLTLPTLSPATPAAVTATSSAPTTFPAPRLDESPSVPAPAATSISVPYAPAGTEATDHTVEIAEPSTVSASDTEIVVSSALHEVLATLSNEDAQALVGYLSGQPPAHAEAVVTALSSQPSLVIARLRDCTDDADGVGLRTRHVVSATTGERVFVLAQAGFVNEIVRFDSSPWPELVVPLSDGVAILTVPDGVETLRFELAPQSPIAADPDDLVVDAVTATRSPITISASSGAEEVVQVTLQPSVSSLDQIESDGPVPGGTVGGDGESEWLSGS